MNVPIRDTLMTNVLAISTNEIKLLTDVQLTELLQTLLYCEVRSHNVPDICVSTSLDIRIADGGEDASVSWQGDPDVRDWITNDSFFQIKATQMGGKACAKELLESDEITLKPKIKELLERGGRYVMFCNQPGHKTREKTMKEQLQKSGFGDSKQADIRVYDPTLIANWTNKYLAAITFVRECLGRGFPMHFQTWQGLSGYDAHSTPYFADTGITDKIKVLQNSVRKFGDVVRITGLPGLGKTRLILESFREIEFRSRLAYFDAAASGGELTGFLSWMRGMAGILVVDNCSRDLHALLVQEIKHAQNRFSLITIDFNPDSIPGDQDHIKFLPVSDELIRQILEYRYKALPPDDLTRIVRFAEGFPRMAVLLSEANLRQETSLANQTNQQLVEKLLWEPKKENAEALRVIEACSLFTRFHFDETLNDEIAFIAKHIVYIDAQRVFDHIKHFEKRGIIQTIGSYARVTPKPLAWRLALDWWERCSTNFATDLASKEWPKSLVIALCDQLTFLHDTPAAGAIAEKLCGTNHPFAEAESLNTDMGSRIFRSLSQVNPESALACLDRVYGDLTPSEIVEVGPGRRHLVWALEDLCFWASTFPGAARLMLLFAAGENEKISNNATGQFAQLFQARLPGTQANLGLRYNTLKQFLETDNEEMQSVLQKAIGKGLEFSSFHRTMGVEQQGGRMGLMDYDPAHQEILDYWKNLVMLLVQKEWATKKIQLAATHEAARFMLALIRYRMIDVLEIVVDKVLEKGDFWTEGLQQLQFALKHDGVQLSAEEKERVAVVQNKLLPKTISDKFRLLITDATYDDYEYDEAGSITGLSTKQIAQLSDEVGPIWPSWKNQLREVLAGDQRQADTFGVKLSGTVSDPVSFIDAAIELLSLDEQARNPSLLGGFLAELKKSNPELVSATIDRIANSPSLHNFAIWLMSRVGLDNKSVPRALALLQNNHITVRAFHSLAFGGVLKALPTDSVLQMTDALCKKNVEGKIISLTLLSMFSYQDDNRWLGIADSVQKLLMDKEVLDGISSSENTMDAHYWEQFCIKLIESENSFNTNFATSLAEQIVSQCGIDDNRRIYKIDGSLQVVSKALLTRDHVSVWPIFGAALSSENWRTRHDAEIVFGNAVEPGETPGLMFFELPQDYLLQWCKSYGEPAQKCVARRLPILERTTEGVHLSAFCKSFLELFGHNSEVISQLDQNLWNFTWVGTMSTPYEDRLKVIESLTGHKHPATRKWAKRVILGLKQQLESSRKRDAEHAAGIYDRW